MARGTVFIIADTRDEAFEEASRRGLNQEDSKRALYVAADGSTCGHSLAIRRPITYVNLTGKALELPVQELIDWLKVEEESE